MLEINTYFKKDDIHDIVLSLSSLSAPIKPVKYGVEESLALSQDYYDDRANFEKCIKENPYGFFMFAEKCFYNIVINDTEYANIYVDSLNKREILNPELAVLILDHFRKNRLVYGFAADDKEYYHRNSINLLRSVGDMTAWAGRDLRKYLPGIYWITAISEEYANQKEIDLDKLPQTLWMRPADGATQCRLYCFFEKPERWKKQVKILDKYCQETNNVFSIKEVKRGCWKYWNFLKINQYLSNYR